MVFKKEKKKKKGTDIVYFIHIDHTIQVCIMNVRRNIL